MQADAGAEVFQSCQPEVLCWRREELSDAFREVVLEEEVFASISMLTHEETKDFDEMNV